MTNKNLKIGFYVSLVILTIGFITVFAIKSFIKSMMEGKPVGPYHSSISIEESKKTKVLSSIFTPTKNIYYSESKQQSYKIDEAWIEKNNNNPKIHWEESSYQNILNVNFKYLTNDDLHKFRLIKKEPRRLDMFEQIEYPDGTPKIRFLLNDYSDTLKLEVIERNPTDSLNWTTEKVIDR